MRALEAMRPGLLFSRVQTIAMETRTSQCTPLYEGQETCDEALAFLRSLGFAPAHGCPRQKGWCERTMKFYNAKLGGSFAAVLSAPPALRRPASPSRKAGR